MLLTNCDGSWYSRLESLKTSFSCQRAFHVGNMSKKHAESIGNEFSRVLGKLLSIADNTNQGKKSALRAPRKKKLTNERLQ